MTYEGMERLQVYVAPQETLQHLTKGLERLDREWCGRLLVNLKGVALPVLNRIGHAVHSLFIKGSWMNNAGIAATLHHRIEDLKKTVDEMDITPRNRAALKDMKAELGIMTGVCNKLEQHGAKNTEKIETAIQETVALIEKVLKQKVKSQTAGRGVISEETLDELLKLAKEKKLPTYKEMLKHKASREMQESGPSYIAAVPGFFDFRLLADLKKGLIAIGGATEIGKKLKFNQGFKVLGHLYEEAERELKGKRR